MSEIETGYSVVESFTDSSKLQLPVKYVWVIIAAEATCVIKIVDRAGPVPWILGFSPGGGLRDVREDLDSWLACSIILGGWGTIPRQ